VLVVKADKASSGIGKPLIDAWFLRYVRSWERRMFRVVPRIHPMSSRLVTG
jgi:hypothetical protein